MYILCMCTTSIPFPTLSLSPSLFLTYLVFIYFLWVETTLYFHASYPLVYDRPRPLQYSSIYTVVLKVKDIQRDVELQRKGRRNRELSEAAKYIQLHSLELALRTIQTATAVTPPEQKSYTHCIGASEHGCENVRVIYVCTDIP